ncbi:MAG: GTP-binding protein [Blastocatellia bacterium]|nr:GTP-binding protein [Blastocatellia bacterium]MBL8195445.1 GTP-binding protein [Blastocatellia bacterium]MBN8725998.1 GTP-binding protein [Acidobacteriota bacterium]
MIQKKICMLGAFATGKTSLVARFVKSIFSEKYHTTVGVKIDKKVLKVGSEDLMLMLWDLAGEDEFNKVQMSYLRGSAGYILVVDGTRRSTLDKAFSLQKNVEEAIGKVPFILVLNKADLVEDWEIDQATITELTDQGLVVIKGSAKTGEGVEELFLSLAEKMVGA